MIADTDMTGQGTKLSDIPLLGSILQTLSTMKIERQILQQVFALPQTWPLLEMFALQCRCMAAALEQPDEICLSSSSLLTMAADDGVCRALITPIP